MPCERRQSGIWAQIGCEGFKSSSFAHRAGRDWGIDSTRLTEVRPERLSRKHGTTPPPVAVASPADRRPTTRTKPTSNAKRHAAQPCPKNTGQVGAMKESDSALLGF